MTAVSQQMAPADGHQAILNKMKKVTGKQKADEHWQLE